MPIFNNHIIIYFWPLTFRLDVEHKRKAGVGEIRIHSHQITFLGAILRIMLWSTLVAQDICTQKYIFTHLSKSFVQLMVPMTRRS